MTNWLSTLRTPGSILTKAAAFLRALSLGTLPANTRCPATFPTEIETPANSVRLDNNMENRVSSEALTVVIDRGCVMNATRSRGRTRFVFEFRPR